MSEIKIEEGVPMPAQSKYPFADMKPQDSFFVACDDPSKIRRAAVAAGQRLGAKFSCRAENGGVRVWRVAAMLLCAVAVSSLMLSTPADAGGKGKDRGSSYGGKHGGKGYGHDRDRRGGRHGGRHHGHHYGKPDKGHDYCSPGETPDPEPEPEPQPTPSRPDRPSSTISVAPAPDQDTDSNSRWLNQFGGHLSGDAVTSKMVSDFVHGARDLDEIEVDRSGPVIQLRPAPEAETAPFSKWRVLVR